MKRIIHIVVASMFMVSMLTGCVAGRMQKHNGTTIKEEQDKTQKKEAENIDPRENAEREYSFSVLEAIVGTKGASKEPVVVLGCSFTNDSEESLSFFEALEATMMQNGCVLEKTHLTIMEDFDYENVPPGKAIPIMIGWKILDTEGDVTLRVNDNLHSTEQEIYRQTFTIEELIENTDTYQDSKEMESLSL